MQDIFEQVDEQLEADRLQKWWLANRNVVITGFVVFFASLFAYVGWQDYRLRQSQAASEYFLVVQDLYTKGDHAGAEKQLQALLQNHSGHAYSQFGRVLQAKSLAATGKREEALQQLEEVAKGADLNLLRDLALLNAAYLTAGESGKAEGYVQRMDGQSPYRAHALELRGLLAAQRGDKQAAVAHYREARGLSTEGSLRARLESRLERMGGEESK
ncbi:YfgM family protein [Candidatus Magnetaquicoccus inordinatus]|uniref:YfgM family protein n=1 Tax=Candidatus Magnetaquicoccus inordinatus TaxID=2496818 RepID=UPI00102B1431|nr:tetratricopeptide repeat protein [Candidatus Magnetaquicoccus inordinatus]